MLLAGGVVPGGLMEVYGLDPVGPDLLKVGYNPDQPRVPAGNPDGGQWTSAQPSPSEVDLVDFEVGSVKTRPDGRIGEKRPR
jgi:hypothetical protein